MTTYIGDNTARLASILEPATVTLATIYVMAWGYLHLTGKIDEPVVSGVRRIVTIAIILGVGLRLWLYNSLIVDTFYSAPTQLAAAVVGSSDPVATIDIIWDRGGAVAGNLWNKGRPPERRFRLLCRRCRGLVSHGLAVRVCDVLFALSSIALAVLLALGPLFIACHVLRCDRRFFGAWIAQMANYALITLLTVMVAALFCMWSNRTPLKRPRGARQSYRRRAHMVLIAVLVFLVLRQVMPIASGLAGGAAL